MLSIALYSATDDTGGGAALSGAIAGSSSMATMIGSLTEVFFLFEQRV